MSINATLINLYHVCPREMWLHTNGINMGHTSDTVYDGKLLHETSYPQRAEKYREIDLSFTLNNGIDLFGKIDFYDAKEKIIHEIKRSEKMEAAHEWQVKVYNLFVGIKWHRRLHLSDMLLTFNRTIEELK